GRRGDRINASARVHHAIRRRGGCMAPGGAGTAADARGRLSEQQVTQRSAYLVAAFRQGLEESGYLEGQNVHILFRWAEGGYARLPELAAELVHARVAVIASVGGPISALAAKQATATIPIVAVSSDPVKHGLVASFNRPGGNVTVV